MSDPRPSTARPAMRRRTRSRKRVPSLPYCSSVLAMQLMVMCPPYPPDQVDTLSSRAPQPARFWPWAPEFGFLRPEPNADVPTEAINRFILTARDRSANCDRRDDGRAAYGI